MFSRMPPKKTILPQQDWANPAERELLPPGSAARPPQPLPAQWQHRARTRLPLPHNPLRPALTGAAAWL